MKFDLSRVDIVFYKFWFFFRMLTKKHSTYFIEFACSSFYNLTLRTYKKNWAFFIMKKKDERKLPFSFEIVIWTVPFGFVIVSIVWNFTYWSFQWFRMVVMMMFVFITANVMNFWRFVQYFHFIVGTNSPFIGVAFIVSIATLAFLMLFLFFTFDHLLFTWTILAAFAACTAVIVRFGRRRLPLRSMFLTFFRRFLSMTLFLLYDLFTFVRSKIVNKIAKKNADVSDIRMRTMNWIN